MTSHRLLIFLGSLAIVTGLTLLNLPSGSIPVAAAAAADARFVADDLDSSCKSALADTPTQCGSQASSCKNCHEVKGEDPVNTQGAWHVSHAFGDFCEFCHGGNVQAPEKDAAHQGLVEPLGDVKTNCSSCHEDYEATAQTYAAALGVTVGTSGGGSAEPPTQPSDSGESAPPASEPDSAPAPSGTEVIDYVAEYESGSAPPLSPGNLVVGGLLVLTVLGGGAFIYWNEKRLRNLRLPVSERGLKPTASSAQAETLAPARRSGASAGVVDPPSDIAGELSPELAKLLPALQSLDPRTLRALRIILADRKRGEELLQSLSLINFAVLEEMKRLDKRELSLLLALASET